MAFFAKCAWTPSASSSRTVSSLTSLTTAYMPPIVRMPEPGAIWSRICVAWRCLFFAERVISSMTPMISTKGRI